MQKDRMEMQKERMERERMNAEITMRLDEERKEREKMDDKLDSLLKGANSVSECGEVVQVTDLLML